jgi:predicted transposase/invertase (TIGR01784 family)
MKHAIDPKIDCVFKAILGSEDNANLLIHFLNAILGQELNAAVVSVEIINPCNEKETRQEKLSIVDVKARDQDGHLFQVEIQITVYPSLPDRIAYTWASLYSKQLRKGKNYASLKPVYSIWIVDGNVNEEKGYSHRYRLKDDNSKPLNSSGGIWLFELPKFKVHEIKTELERWLRLFKDGEKLDDSHLPPWMQTPEMEQVIKTMSEFSEKEHRYEQYRARQDYLREQSTIQADLKSALRDVLRERQEKEAALKAREVEKRAREIERREKKAALQREKAALQREAAERQEKERERQEKEAALQREQAKEAEIERLKALLEQKNL